MIGDREFMRAERTFRHVTGSVNLADHQGEPYALAPGTSLSYSIDAIRIEIVGQDLLGHLDQWAGDPNATLQLGHFARDSFGKLVDREAFQEWELDGAEDWARGTHSRTMVLTDPAPPGQPTNRGLLVAYLSRADLAAGRYTGEWLSEWHAFPVAGSLDYIAWDVGDAVDRDANEQQRYFVEVRCRSGAVVSPWINLSNAPGASYQDMGVSVTNVIGTQSASDAVQLRVTLDPRDPGMPNPVRSEDLKAHPPAVRRLKVYYRLDEPTYAWRSLSDLILDAVHPPELRQDSVRVPGFFGGSKLDSAFLEVPYSAELSGAVGEYLGLTFRGAIDELQSIRALADGYVSEIRPGGS